MTTCPKCNIKLEEGMKFCYKCGSKILAVKEKCLQCGTKLKQEMKFCYKCGAEIGETKEVQLKEKIVKGPKKEDAVQKGTEDGLPKDASLWNKFTYAFSNFFDEEDIDKESNESEEDKIRDEEIDIDFSSLWSNKYILFIIILLVIIIIGGLFYIFKKGPTEQSAPVFKAIPIVKYNPNTKDAILIIEDETFVRHNEVYGDYADLMVNLQKEEGDTPSKSTLKNVFQDVPNPVDILIKDEIPNYEDQPYEVEVHTSIPLKKVEDKGYWESDKFKLYPYENAVFIIEWNDVEEFPYGSMNGISLVYSEDI